MSTPTLPGAFHDATAFITAYLAADENGSEVAEEALAQLASHPGEQLAVVLAATVGTLVTELADAHGQTPAETWARHALAVSVALNGAPDA